MINKLFIENKNSLGEYLLSLGQQFKVTTKLLSEVVRTGRGSSYKSTINGFQCDIQPVFQVVLKNEGDDLVRILIPEHKYHIDLKYTNSDTVCSFSYIFPQQLIKYPINLKELTGDFDKAEELVNEQVIKVINSEVKEMFNGKKLDGKREWTIAGKSKPIINVEYFV